jgi:D-alanyl-D-alanine carboxypeptidase
MKQNLKTILVFALLSIYFNHKAEAFQQKQDVEFIKKIEKTLDTLYNENRDYGGATIGIVMPDNVQYQFAIGYADVNKKIKMSTNNLMLGGSTGKVFVSAAIMQQVAKGNVNLEDKLINYLKEYKWYKRIQNFDSVTIRNLMQHSSGISRYVFTDEFLLDVKKDADRIWKPQELLSYVLDKEPLFEVGKSFAYSDTNYILLAMVLEKVTDESMYSYIDKNILNPFNLSNIKPQVSRTIANLPIGYNGSDDSFYPGVVVEDKQYKYNLQFEWAGGGYVMSALDLARTGKLIYENKIFNESLNKDFYNGIDAKQLGGQWGLGVHISDTPHGKSYGHSGFFPGYITNLLYFPELEFSIVFQVNVSDRQKLSLYRKLYLLIPLIKDYIKK